MILSMTIYQTMTHHQWIWASRMADNYGITKIIMDMDSQKYKACWAANPKNGSSPPSFPRAVSCLNNIMRGQFKYLEQNLKKPMNIKEMFKKGKLKTYVTAMNKSNFRYDIATIEPYKSDRHDKPLFLEEMHNWLIRKWYATEVHGMEADDAVGIESAQDPQHTLIWHEDKDLWQLYGWHGWFEVSKACDSKEFHSNEGGQLTLVNTRKLMYVSYPGTYFLERSHSGELKLFTTGEFKLGQQLLQGDSGDTIPKVVTKTIGNRQFGFGDMDVFKVIIDCGGDHLLFHDKIKEIYKKYYPETHESRYSEIYKLVKILDKPLEGIC